MMLRGTVSMKNLSIFGNGMGIRMYQRIGAKTQA